MMKQFLHHSLFHVSLLWREHFLFGIKQKPKGSFRPGIILLLFLAIFNSAHGQTTTQFGLSNSVVAVGNTGTGVTSSQGELIAGNAYYDQTWRGYVEFNISSIPKNATITAASLTLKCTEYTGKAFDGTSGTIALKNLSNRPTSFNSLPDWTFLNGVSQITSTSATVNNSITISNSAFTTKVKNSLVEGFVYFGVVNTAEAANGLRFSINDADLVLSVTYTVPVPAAPTNLQASAITSSGCTLSWTKPAGSVSRYKIYSDNVYVLTTGSTSVVITDLSSNTTYSFTVTAVNSSGESPKSGAISVRTLASPPSIPTDLTARNTSSGCALSWTASTGEVIGYKIYQDGNLIQTTATTSTHTTIIDLTNSTRYTFTVSAYNSGGESAQSVAVAITIGPVPLPPNYLNYYNIVGTTGRIGWSPSPGSVTGYKLYQVSGPTTWTITTSSTYHLLSDLQPDVVYIYLVKAYNTYGESEASQTIGFMIPSAPSSLAVDNITSTECSLSWSAPSSFASSYRIYKDGAYIKSSSTTNALVTGLTPGTAHTFTVSAHNGSAESVLSNSVVANTLDLSVPSAPASLMASNITNTGCDLSWSASEGVVTGYNIYRDGTLIRTVASTTATISDLMGSSVYSFIVRAYNGAGESESSNVISVNTPAPALPTSPANLVASNITSVGCTLSWTASSGVVTGYNIYQNGSMIQSSASATVILNNLSPNSSYSFIVKAYNSAGESEPSNSIIVNTPLVSTPNDLHLTRYSSSGCTLSWSPVEGPVTGYYMYIYVGTSLLRKFPVASTTYNFSGGTGTFTFYVSAYNSNGESLKSHGIAVTFPPRSSSLIQTTEESTKDNAFFETNEDIRLYPNPVIDKLSVFGLLMFEATVYDLNGEVVMERKGANDTIDLSALHKGTYIIRLTDANRTIVRRIVKQ